MKHGPAIVNFLHENQEKVRGIRIQGDSDRPGSLKISLNDGSEIIFDGWDEEDQGLFACALKGEPWDPSKRGIPSTLTILSDAEKMEIATDKKVDINICGEPLEKWGEKQPEPVKLSGESFTIWKKKPVAESSAQGARQSTSQDAQPPTFGGMKKGFLG